MNLLNSLFSSRTVVLWNDSADVDEPLSSLVSAICSKGYQLQIANSEYQAIKSVIDQQADLLIIYLRASRSRGYGLCEILRSQQVNKYLPIVFVGYRDNHSERIKVLRCGGNEYLKLPITGEETWLRLEQHLSLAQRVRQLEVDRSSLAQKVSEYSRVLEQQEQLKVSLAKENQALQRLAFVDGLTQVANRRSFNQSIAELWKEAMQKRQPLSLLLCDIDYFKRYNDTYGHVEGDRCLQAVAAALLRGAHRFQDHVARYGGEEFAILLPATDLEGAQKVAFTIQSEMLQMQMAHDSSLVAPWVTLSVGICTMVPDRENQQPCESLIHGSDEAMYTAKLRGRNRSVVNTLTELVSIERNYCLCDYQTQVKDLKKYWHIAAQREMPDKNKVDGKVGVLDSQSDGQISGKTTDNGIMERAQVAESHDSSEYSQAIAAELSRRGLPHLLSQDSVAQLKTP